MGNKIENSIERLNTLKHAAHIRDIELTPELKAEIGRIDWDLRWKHNCSKRRVDAAADKLGAVLLKSSNANWVV